MGASSSAAQRDPRPVRSRHSGGLRKRAWSGSTPIDLRHRRTADRRPERTPPRTMVRVIVGSSYIDKRHVINYPYEQIMGFRWEDRVQTDLPWLPPDDEAYPLDVNADGTIAVGGSWETEVTWLCTSMAAARWVNGVPEDLGKLPVGPIWYDEDAYAVAVSADGSVVVGQSGEEGGYWRPFVWKNGDMEPSEHTPVTAGLPVRQHVDIWEL